MVTSLFCVYGMKVGRKENTHKVKRETKFGKYITWLVANGVSQGQMFYLIFNLALITTKNGSPFIVKDMKSTHETVPNKHSLLKLCVGHLC